MATIEKRGKGYRTIVHQGYNYKGKRLRRMTTWIPEPDMTER